MSQSATVSIPTPCPELWEQMSNVAGGRHCTLCQKTVQDFTYFSDRELANWLATYNGSHVCGRFRTDQLERPIRQVRSEPLGKRNWVRWVVALVVSWQTAKGQTVPPHRIGSPTSLSPVVTRNVFTLTEPVLFYVTGRVIDEKGNPYQAAMVKSDSSQRSVLTNHNGEFRVPIYLSDHLQEPLRLLVRSRNSQRTVFVATRQEQEPLLITMHNATVRKPEIVGGSLAIVRQEPAQRRSFWQFLSGKR